MRKRFYTLLSILSAVTLSPLFIFPLGIANDITNILFLVYPFLPFLSLLIIYRNRWGILWGMLHLSGGKNTLRTVIQSLLLWNLIFYGGLILATLANVYSWDFQQGGLSNWLSERLNEFADANQVPIPILPLTTKQLAQLGVGVSVLAPFLLFPFFFVQELVWRSWLPSQSKDQSLLALVKSNGVWGIWQVPLVLLGQIYSESFLGIPAIIISAILQGTLLSLITQKTGSIFSATIARGVIFASVPLAIIFHAPGSTTSPFVVGFYGISSWTVMGGIIFWLHKKNTSRQDDIQRLK